MKVTNISQFGIRRPCFKASLTKADFAYKNRLIEGLRDTFNVKVSLESLKSVLAPDELKVLLKKFRPRDYAVGKTPNAETSLQEIFENVKNRDYRVNLHTHTINSDGRMNAYEYLSQSVEYADSVAAKKYTGDIPPFTSAITDHNNINGVKEVISMIAQNPEKYRNFKFVAGCEFLIFDDEHGLEKPTYEVVGLGFNPFDKELNENLSDKNPITLINKIRELGGVVSYAHPLRFCQGQKMNEKFVKYLLSIAGINGIESNYQYLFRNMAEVLEQNEQIYRIAKENNLYETGGTDTHARNIFSHKVEPVLDMIL